MIIFNGIDNEQAALNMFSSIYNVSWWKSSVHTFSLVEYVSPRNILQYWLEVCYTCVIACVIACLA